MKKVVIGLIVAALAVTGMTQDRNHQRGGGHAAPSRPASRPAQSRPASRATSAPRQTTRTRSTTRTYTSHSGTRTYTSSHTYSGNHGTHRGRHGGVAAGGWHGTVVHSYRPGGMGHPRSWFEARHWHEGPAFIAPTIACYAGYVWSSIPPNYQVVWIWDEATQQYYEAYYYPQYGYYAWASNPLYAVGEYSPSISIVIG